VTSPAVGAVVVHGRADTPRFALTFDDGPSPCTAKLLPVLERRGVRATFFMVGSQVERDPGQARAVLAAGHEIGTHSMSHLEHQHAPREEAVADMLDGAKAIERALGMEPRLYRAPYGHFAPGAFAEAERRGWTCVLWSAEGSDWRTGEDAHAIFERIAPDLRPGAIVLLHDGRREKPIDCERMLAALELILNEGERRGLAAVTVGELLGAA
jgi:peptidoglycan/xylan/chitin deacetylase (PgdA/CDA1 family)